MLAFLFTSASAQNPSKKAHPKLMDGLQSCKQITAKAIANDQSSQGFQSNQVIKPDVPENTDAVSIISIGTSANAYGYGYGGGQRCLLSVNNDLNTVTNFHRMGGTLDPGGYSGDLGYDISTDGGMTWTNMVECYVCTENAGGSYYTDATRYPNHGIYNPPGNTNPNNAFVTFFAPNLDGSNSADSWGGYSYGRAKIGSPANTTKHLLSSRPTEGYYQYIPDAFTITSQNDYWVVDQNQDWSSGTMNYLEEMIVSHGVWNNALQNFELTQFLLDCPTQLANRPTNTKIEFSPDGQTGYIAVLGDNGTVPISTDLSYYPILWRTEDGGQTWSNPITVAIAGPDGIEDVQNFLSETEISELYEAPVPARDEILFSTAFDFDLSVDVDGNPVIAVVCGITGSNAGGVDPYTIVSSTSSSSDYAYTCAFLLSSTNRGNEGSWIGYELGRLNTFRGIWGDWTEDNRIQIARNHPGSKLFVSWLDTETTSQNNNPNIWARGVDIVAHTLTDHFDGQDLPDNVTFGSYANNSAYFFAMGNEVLSFGNGFYTIPFTYENMTPYDPGQPVQFKYIQDFQYHIGDFTIPYSGTIPMQPPTNLTATVDESTVSLTWDAPITNNLEGYLVYRDGVKITPFTIPNTSYTNFNVDPGMHSYYVTAEYDEIESGSSNVVTVNIQIITPEYFEPVWTSPYNPMTVYILEATIDGYDMQSGDEVGLFDIDPTTGDQICVGTGVLTEPLTGVTYLEFIASMDDGSNPEQANGFTPGNNIIYKLWNEEAGEITSITATYPYPGYDEVYTSQGSAFVELNGVNEITQCIGLSTGWNILSFRAIPENPDMLNVVQPLIDEDMLVKVLDESGGSIFHLPFPPPNGQWSNTIGDMENTEGYYIKVSDLGNLCVIGQPVETPLTIPLTTGWNIISYPCEYAQNALDAVQPLINAGVLTKVIDESGGSIFHLPFPPPNGQWSNTIGNFESGEGYYLKVTQSTSLTLTCPTDFTETFSPNSEQIKTSHFIPVYESNPYMPMHIALYPNNELMPGDELGVFDGDICVGTAIFDGNYENPIIIPVTMDDPTTEIIDGFTPDNAITLLTWNSQTSQEAELQTETISGNQTFEGLETYTGVIQGLQTKISEYQDKGIKYEFSPNPFGENLKLSISLPSSGNLKIEVFDLMGQNMNFAYSSVIQKGSHIISLDKLQLRKGTYLVNFTFSNESKVFQFTDKIIKN